MVAGSATFSGLNQAKFPTFAPLEIAFFVWSRIADNIIRFRLPLMGVIAVLTAIMGYYATKVEMSYDFTRTVPPNDPDMIFLNKFKEQFGEDGNIVAVGMKDSAVYHV